MDRPNINPPNLSPKVLAEIIEAAWGTVSIEGANVTTDGAHQHFILQQPPQAVPALVYLVEDDSSSGSSSVGSVGSTPPTCIRRRYWFIVQKRVKGGCFEPIVPEQTGDGQFDVAYEINDMVVEDGSIQYITPDFWWYDPDAERGVQEWTFRAGSGGKLVELSVVLDGCIEDVLTESSSGPPSSFISSSSGSKGKIDITPDDASIGSKTK